MHLGKSLLVQLGKQPSADNLHFLLKCQLHTIKGIELSKSACVPDHGFLKEFFRT